MGIKEKLLGDKENPPRGFKQLDKAIAMLRELGILVQEIHVHGDVERMGPGLVQIEISAKLPLELSS